MITISKNALLPPFSYEPGLAFSFFFFTKVPATFFPGKVNPRCTPPRRGEFPFLLFPPSPERRQVADLQILSAYLVAPSFSPKGRWEVLVKCCQLPSCRKNLLLSPPSPSSSIAIIRQIAILLLELKAQKEKARPL